MSKSYFIENLGCAKNQVDAEVMIAVLDAAGWNRMSEPRDASVIVVNTCGFIDPAKEESINVTLSYRDTYPDAKIVMAGCLTQRYSEAIAAELPETDGIFGNRAPEEIAGFLDGVTAGTRRVYVPERTGVYPYRTQRMSFPGSAFVKVSEGCRNRCSFCAIPLIRGGLHSRPIDGVVDEVRRLIGDGVFEINLVAQDLSAFGLDRGRRDLLPLLERISALDGKFWIRLLYIYPESFPLDVLELMSRDARFVPYFDIPFQHASEPVLRRMGRPGSAEEYLRLIERIRLASPGSVIRTSLLVGFVGETDEDFARLLEFQRQAEIDWLGTFTYSAEEGTPAYAARDEAPPPELAVKRKEVIDAVQQDITARRLETFVGRALDVLIEEPVEGEELVLARAYAHAPEVDGAVVLHTGDRRAEFPPGSVVQGVITRRNGIDLEARPVP
mgnify:CR=1 FL=1